MDFAGGELAILHWVNGNLPSTPGALIPSWSFASQVHGYLQVLDVVSQPVPSVVYATHYEACQPLMTPTALAFDGLEAVMAGRGRAPVTPGAFSLTPASSSDGFVGRLGLGVFPDPLQSFGSSCAGSNGTPTLDGVSAARLCGTLRMEVRSAPAFTATLLLGGLSNTLWAGLPLPFPLDSVGAPGCAVRVDIVAVANRGADGNGVAPYSIPVPIDPTLLPGGGVRSGGEQLRAGHDQRTARRSALVASSAPKRCTY